MKLSRNQGTRNGTFTSVQNLIDIPNANEYVETIFDVRNLFTIVPLDEIIIIIMNLCIWSCMWTLVFGFYPNHFRKFLNLATNWIYFFFNRRYKQIEDDAMGNPLDPNLANIFMCHIEEIWLINYPSDKQIFLLVIVNMK